MGKYISKSKNTSSSSYIYDKKRRIQVNRVDLNDLISSPSTSLAYLVLNNVIYGYSGFSFYKFVNNQLIQLNDIPTIVTGHNKSLITVYNNKIYSFEFTTGTGNKHYLQYIYFDGNSWSEPSESILVKSSGNLFLGDCVAYGNKMYFIGREHLYEWDWNNLFVEYYSAYISDSSCHGVVYHDCLYYGHTKNTSSVFEKFDGETITHLPAAPIKLTSNNYATELKNLIVWNNKIYLFGGSVLYPEQVWAFDDIGNEWVRMDDTLYVHQPRSGVVVNNELWLMGDLYSSFIEKYNSELRSVIMTT